MNLRTHSWLVAACLAVAAGSPCWAQQSATSQPAGPNLRQSMHDLWHSSVSALVDKGALSDLPAISRQLGLMDVFSHKNIETLPAVLALAEPTRRAVEQAVARRFEIDANTLEQLKLAPAKGPACMLTLADSLFGSEQFDAAATLYETVLGQDQSPATKAWALFQMANCARTKDPAAATTLYKRVADEYPDSLWAEVAQEQSRLIDWQQSVNPQAMLQKLATNRK